LLPDSDLDTAIAVDGLCVRFRTLQEKSPTLRNSLLNLGSRSSRTVEALKHVSFEVPSGAVFGVIGRNGAGKSTLFRTLAGILPPTEGRIVVVGRVTPLLSLGVGFNRGLSGRENILLGGLAAGLDPGEIGYRYEEIVQFADLGEALSYPMRTYSSGMFARLGFAISAHLDPEILLIDEALSAGDATFRQKCTDKILELCERDCTVMIVSHGLQVVRKLASQCLWLDEGRVLMKGDADDVVSAYLERFDPAAGMTALEDF
jgi:ABC-type polysaccharide/polyol phosphate transport system ATPase subunit